MFEGAAEEAMGFYTSTFEDAEVVSIARYGPGEAGREGSVMQAVFAIRGQEFMCIDSPGKHPFTFTPAISLFVTCESEEEIDRLVGELSRGGTVLIPLDTYPFSRRFAWVADRFGVSWQLSLPHL